MIYKIYRIKDEIFSIVVKKSKKFIILDLELPERPIPKRDLKKLRYLHLKLVQDLWGGFKISYITYDYNNKFIRNIHPISYTAAPNEIELVERSIQDYYKERIRNDT